MDLYKQRWQIELFFKWVKQDLKIKRFFGTSEHAVYLQVLIAMIVYLLLKRLNNSLSTLQISLQKLTRLIAANLFQRRSIMDLIASAHEKRIPDKNPFGRQQLEILLS
jgi:putative transposase